MSQKKYRLETGLFLAEGINLIRDIPPYAKVRSLFYTPARKDEAEELLNKFGAQGETEGFCVTESVMDQLSDTVTPYGIAAVLEMPDVGFRMPEGNALLLDGVADPGNMGTIVRTAAACGFSDIYALDCVDAYAPKVIRATLGGIFSVRVHEIDFETALTLARSESSVVLDMDGENLLEFPPAPPVLLVLGSEAHGVREEIRKAARNIRSLPMKNGMESLNVAVAAAVAMYRVL